MGTNLSLMVQSRMEDKVRIKNFKSLFEFFEKFGREVGFDCFIFETSEVKVQVGLAARLECWLSHWG